MLYASERVSLWMGNKVSQQGCSLLHLLSLFLLYFLASTSSPVPLAFIGDNKPCFVITAVRTHAVLTLLVSCFEWWIQREQPGGTEGYFLVTQAELVVGWKLCVSRFVHNSKKFTPPTWRVVKVISETDEIESDFCFQPSVCLSVCEYVSL